MIVTSETIYAQEALPALLRVFQKCLAKPNGVMYVICAIHANDTPV